jgi:hypothetical protein
MEMLCCNVAALAVALLYYFWRTYDQARAARRRVLGARVAYMLWVMAEQMGPQSEAISVG